MRQSVWKAVLWFAVAFVPLCCGLAGWQRGYASSLVIGTPSNAIQLSGFYDQEQGAAGPYRWSRPQATITLPAAALPGIIELRGAAGPATTQLALTIGAAQPIYVPNVPSQIRRYMVLGPTTSNYLPWVSLAIHATTAPSSADQRQLGLLMQEIKTHPLNRRLPPLLPLLLVCASALLLALCMRSLCIPLPVAALVGMLAGGGLVLWWSASPLEIYALLFGITVGLVALVGLLKLVPPTSGTPWQRIGVLTVFAIALGLRLYAADTQPAHFDEDDYLRAGQRYAQHIAAGDFGAIINERENYEHPPLVKLAFGAILFATAYPQQYEDVYVGMKRDPALITQTRPLRLTNALLGALTAALVATVNPLAGLLVAANAWHTTFSGLTMLEALPALCAACALVALRRSRASGDRWWWLAAGALGAAAAGKYMYGVVGIPLLGWLCWRYRRNMAHVALWAIFALGIFFMLDPALWPDPVERLHDSLLFSVRFTSGSAVQNAAYPWYQPLAWLFASGPPGWPLLPLLIERAMLLLCTIAIWRNGRNEQVATVWLLGAFGFLLIWPTKWEQYVVPLAVPGALLAATFVQDQLRGCFHHEKTATPQTNVL